jgi:hypothetical protein
MRENQRGSRNYADNACTGTPEVRNRNEKNAEAINAQKKDASPGLPADATRLKSEGMIYLDIIQRFAL